MYGEEKNYIIHCEISNTKRLQEVTFTVSQRTIAIFDPFFKQFKSTIDPMRKQRRRFVYISSNEI